MQEVTCCALHLFIIVLADRFINDYFSFELIVLNETVNRGEWVFIEIFDLILTKADIVSFA